MYCDHFNLKYIQLDYGEESRFKLSWMLKKLNLTLHEQNPIIEEKGQDINCFEPFEDQIIFLINMRWDENKVYNLCI